MVGVIASVAVWGLVLVICAAEPLYILLGETLSLLKSGTGAPRLGRTPRVPGQGHKTFNQETPAKVLVYQHTLVQGI